MKIEIYRDKSIMSSSSGENNVVLVWNGTYCDEDKIVFSDLISDRFYSVKVDAAIETSLIYVKTSSFEYLVPSGERKRSYCPESFTGEIHFISIRNAENFETKGIRNLALNPVDQSAMEGVFPHASANAETRGESVFKAGNAIDGMKAVASHGDWPYESWGINMRDDAEFMLEFGRPVDIDEIRLYTRADFPHDNWWINATIEFSDGTGMNIPLEKHIDIPHVIADVNRKQIEWIRLGNLIKSGLSSSPFRALTQIEVLGSESKGE